jgi:hypothetical protein
LANILPGFHDSPLGVARVSAFSAGLTGVVANPWQNLRR